MDYHAYACDGGDLVEKMGRVAKVERESVEVVKLEKTGELRNKEVLSMHD